MGGQCRSNDRLSIKTHNRRFSCRREPHPPKSNKKPLLVLGLVSFQMERGVVNGNRRGEKDF